MDKEVEKKEQCKHPCLHFSFGGLYLVCCGCGQRYGALAGKTDSLDTTAWTHGVDETGHRSDPFSMKHFLPHRLK